MTNEQGKQDSLDSWDDYISGNFLKSINVKDQEHAFVVINVGEEEMEGSKRPRISIESDGQSYEFDINKTNSVKLKELGVESPKALIGKKIFFIKVMVRNPKLNKEVEGLRISKVE